MKETLLIFLTFNPCINTKSTKILSCNFRSNSRVLKNLPLVSTHLQPWYGPYKHSLLAFTHNSHRTGSNMMHSYVLQLPIPKEQFKWMKFKPLCHHTIWCQNTFTPVLIYPIAQALLNGCDGALHKTSNSFHDSLTIYF